MDTSPALNSDSPPRTLLVGWSAADWNIARPLIDAGKLPTLASLIEDGMMGDLQPVEPRGAPSGWASLATGQRAFHHRVLTPRTTCSKTGLRRHVSPEDWKCPPLWEALAERGLRTQAIGWPGTHPASVSGEGCAVVSPQFAAKPPASGKPWLPASTLAVAPAHTRDTLAEFRLTPDEIGSEVLSLLVPRLDEVDSQTDEWIPNLRIQLAAEFSLHAAATWLLENEPWDFATVLYGGIARVCEQAMAFHPPAMTGIENADGELYSNAVEGIYRLQDAMLGRLIALAGDRESLSVILVSQHGFASGAARPRPSRKGIYRRGAGATHGRPGIFLGSGPAFETDGLLHGAGVLDVAPTVFHIMGLAVPEDLPGRVLAKGTPESGSPLAEHRALGGAPDPLLAYDFDPANSGGYSVDPLVPRKYSGSELLRLAQSYLGARLPLSALPVLESLTRLRPYSTKIRHLLATAQVQLGLADAAEQSLGDASDPSLRGQIAFIRRDFTGALTQFRSAKELAGPGAPARVHTTIGETLERLGEDAEAAHSYQEALQKDPAFVAAHVGLASIALRAHQYQEAADYARKATVIQYESARAHELLGRALGRLKKYAEAVESLNIACSFDPLAIGPRRLLIAVCGLGRYPEETVAAHQDALKTARAAHQRRAEWVAERHTRALNQVESPKLKTGVTPRSEPVLIVAGFPGCGRRALVDSLREQGLKIAPEESRESLKILGIAPRSLDEYAGEVVEAVPDPLQFLPRHLHCRIAYLKRPAAEVAADLKSSRGATLPDLDAQELENRMGEDERNILYYLRRLPLAKLEEIPAGSGAADAAAAFFSAD